MTGRAHGRLIHGKLSLRRLSHVSLVRHPKATVNNPMISIGGVSIPFCYAVDAMCLPPVRE